MSCRDRMAGGKGGGFTVYLRGLGQPIARLNKADHGLSFDGWDRETFGPWKRVFMVPDARLIAVLPPTNDQVVLHHFDAEAALESSGLDYLLVTSRAPREARAGDNYTYPVVVKSKHKVTYKLDSAPKSMEVSPQGLITWAVPREASGDQNVILTIVDSAGQEIFHTFTIRIKA